MDLSWATWATWACHGPLRASSDVYAHSPASRGPLRTTAGLNWPHMGLSWTATGLYWIQPAPDGSLLDSLSCFFSFSFFSLATQIPLLQWGGLGGGVGAVLLQLEICLVGHTVLGAGWSP